MLLNKKHQKRYSLRQACPKHLLRFGKFGIKTTSFYQISRKQLDLLEWSITKKLKMRLNKKSFKVWNLVATNLNLTKLNLESRMGKGKGQIYTSAAFLKPGSILFEIDNISYQDVREIFTFINKKTSAILCLVKNKN